MGLRRDWRRSLRPRIAALIVSTAAATLLGRAGSLWWPLELLSHFSWQYAVTAIVLGLAALWARGRPWALIAAATALVNLALLSPLYRPAARSAHAAEPPPQPLWLMSFNVNTANTNFEPVLAHIRASRCDLVLVLEVSPQWVTALRSLSSPYRVVIAEPRYDNFGIALVSRIEGVSASFVRSPGSAIAMIDASFRWQGRAWSLLGVHTTPPVSAAMAAERNAMFAQVAAWASSKTGPRIVAGDFNATAFSPVFWRLLDDSGLSSSQRGHGYQPTWPNGVWPLWPAQIPIDDVLYSGVDVLERTVGPALGSDHRPLVVALVAR